MKRGAPVLVPFGPDSNIPDTSAAAARWLDAVKADICSVHAEHQHLVLDRARGPWRRAARAVNAWGEAGVVTWPLIRAAQEALKRLEVAVYGEPGPGTYRDRRATFGEHRAREERARAEAEHRRIWESA